MDYRNLILSMKKSTFNDALESSLRVFDINKSSIGKLVPVGEWLLTDELVLQKITDWRRRFNRMFPTRTSVDSSTTKKYIKNTYVKNNDSIFFLIFTESEELVGHIGLCSLNEKSYELVNLMRGISGGDSDLIYLAEVCLVKFGFGLAGHNECHVEIMSYNWIVRELHEKVGFKKISSWPLFKQDDSTGIRHHKVEISEKNVDYTIDVMSVNKDSFYSLHAFRQV